MDISMFLAQAFGLYFVISGIALLVNQDLVKGLIKKFSSDADSVAIGGFVALVIGVPLVLVHNVWEGSWQILVTVLVWLTFLKGVIRVLAPHAVVSWSKQFGAMPGLVRALLLIMVVVGLYLLYFGFGLNA